MTFLSFYLELANLRIVFFDHESCESSRMTFIALGKKSWRKSEGEAPLVPPSRGRTCLSVIIIGGRWIIAVADISFAITMLVLCNLLNLERFEALSVQDVPQCYPSRQGTSVRIHLPVLHIRKWCVEN